jgi:hypothetical protein
MEHGAAEVDLVPAEVANLGRPEPVPEGDQDHGRVPMTVAVGLGGVDQGVDLAGRQVLAGAQLGVRPPRYPRRRRFLDAPSTAPNVATVRKTSVGGSTGNADFSNEIIPSKT